MVHTLSVVIPVHNEERFIEACLSALLTQRDHLLEVLVVDNNSTDGTRRIVDAIANADPLVAVVDARTPGVVAARNAGFGAASGSLIARIDADTVVLDGWARAIHSFFESTGGRFVGGTGMSYFHDLPFQRPFRAMQQRATASLRGRLDAGRPAAMPEMIGLNMVVTADAWKSVVDETSARSDIHEDVDLSLCLRSRGGELGLVPGMVVATSGRRYLTSLRSFLGYCAAGPRTYRAHGRALAAFTTGLGSSVAVAFYLAMWLPFRAWDPTARRFHPAKLLRRSTAPTTRVMIHR